uniref:piggyBac transposable element-derived protein 4-like n=1 Tax=Ciona intestinalis TaxID=7719 RepID=UPI000EF479FA|nr:piggyBac transposable element-derived protein 4-like [Ciona intestinalis]|eukprot:XP_026694232.1 piggyBac transposable element-derived protein 4-like [Ciona intestinalis]
MFTVRTFSVEEAAAICCDVDSCDENMSLSESTYDSCESDDFIEPILTASPSTSANIQPVSVQDQEVSSTDSDVSSACAQPVHPKRAKMTKVKTNRKRPKVTNTSNIPHDLQDFNWEPVNNSFETSFIPQSSSFSETSGYCGDLVLADSTPLDLLGLFLTNEFWQLLVEETNRYAEQYLQKQTDELPKFSKFRKWSPVTHADIKAYFAMNLLMGLCSKHSIKDYWSMYSYTNTAGISSLMPRDCFQSIRAFLHFNNNENYIPRGQPGHDRIFKIRNIVELVTKNFSKHYTPHKELSLDEMTIAYKGGSSIKQYNPMKPKVFVLSEARTGYALQWDLYTGKSEDVDSSVSKTHAIVRKLSQEYLHKGHDIYMNSYYTNPYLANELSKLKQVFVAP